MRSLANEATVSYVFKQLGVVRSSREVVGMALPYRIEPVNLDGITDARELVDAIQLGRDRLFSATLKHMAEHDDDIRAVLDGIEKASTRRAEIIEVVKGLLK